MLQADTPRAEANTKDERPAVPWNRRLINFKKTSPTLVAFTVVAPPYFLFVLAQSAITTLTVEIAYQMNRAVDSIYWIQHSEMIVACAISVISNRIHSFFGQQLCYVLSTWLVGVANFVIFVCHRHYTVVLILRGVSAIGYALNITATTPMSNYLIPDGQIDYCLSYTIVSVPVASLVATFLFPSMVKSYGWYYIFLVTGVLSLIYSVYLTIFCPYSKMDLSVRIDWPACLWISSGVCAIVLGVGMLETLNIAWVCLLLVVYGIMGFYLFYSRNMATSKPIIAKECFNRNTLTFLLSFFFTCAGSQADTYFYSMILYQILGLSTIRTGVYTGVSKAICLAFMRLFTVVVRRVTIRYISTFCNVAYIVLYVLKIIFLQWWPNGVILWTIYTLNQLLFLQNQLAIMTYNVIGSPPKFAPISSTLVGFCSKFSWSLGIAFCIGVSSISKRVAIYQDIVDPASLQTVGIIYAHFAGVFLFVLSLLFSHNIGVFLWEKGKVGFANAKLVQFDTYDVLKIEIDKYLNKSKAYEQDEMVYKYKNRQKSSHVSCIVNIY